jgi:hypothetical protein
MDQNLKLEKRNRFKKTPLKCLSLARVRARALPDKIDGFLTLLSCPETTQLCHWRGPKRPDHPTLPPPDDL